jgi:hypothetical protein
MDESSSATAICGHKDCGKRFKLSHYGNRTVTSDRRVKQHRFCSPRCRKAHSRRLAAIRGCVTSSEGTIPKACVTTCEITPPDAQKQGSFSPIVTSEQPHPVPREWLRVYLEDEAPAIGCGLRLIAVDKITPKWVRIRDHAGRIAKLTPGEYASLKPVAFGRSTAIEASEPRMLPRSTNV